MNTSNDTKHRRKIIRLFARLGTAEATLPHTGNKQPMLDVRKLGLADLGKVAVTAFAKRWSSKSRMAPWRRAKRLGSSHDALLRETFPHRPCMAVPIRWNSPESCSIIVPNDQANKTQGRDGASRYIRASIAF